MGSQKAALFIVPLFFVAGCTAMRPLPDAASMDAPSDSAKILVLPDYPTLGKKYLVERDGEQEIWLVKDNQGTIEFIDQSSGQTKFVAWPRPGPQAPGGPRREWPLCRLRSGGPSCARFA